jgi:carbonyl reductase 1
VSGERVAVVTGGNRGIGAAVAAGLARRGLRVMATSRAPDEPNRLDVADTASIEAFAARLESLDVLVNNAGVAMKGFDARVARQTIDTNFYGALRVTDRLLPLLRPGARVVMVSSAVGQSSILSTDLAKRFLDPVLERDQLLDLVERFVRDVGEGTHAERGWPSTAYGVSKAALNALTRIYARELAGDPRKLLVNAVCPGWVRTDMGGTSAPRSVEEGASGILWAAMLPDGGPTGGFFRDAEAIDP